MMQLSSYRVIDRNVEAKKVDKPKKVDNKDKNPEIVQTTGK